MGQTFLPYDLYQGQKVSKNNCQPTPQNNGYNFERYLVSELTSDFKYIEYPLTSVNILR